MEDGDFYSALKHPLRREIMKVLLFSREDAISPKELSQLLGKPEHSVNYHVKILRETGAAVLAATEPKRGSLKHYYRAAPALFDETPWVLSALKGGGVAAVPIFKRELTQERLERLSSSEARVLRLRFALGSPGRRSCRQIAEMIGESPERVRELQTDGLRKIRADA